MKKPAQNSDFTVTGILELLVGYGHLQPKQVKNIQLRLPTALKNLEAEYAANPLYQNGRNAVILPPELIASLKVPSAFNADQTIEEDLIYQLLARSMGLRYVKIDPLNLDADLVTTLISRPFARKHTAIPIERKGNEIAVAVANPTDVELFDELRRISNAKIVPVLSSKSDINKVITELFGFRRSLTAAEETADSQYDLNNLEQLFEIQNIQDLEVNDKHIINAVDYLLHYAFDQRASDIHIEPKRDYARIRLRIDGVLHNIHSIAKAIHPAITSRIKLMGRLDIAERRRPQDGRIKTAIGETEVELRVSTVPTTFGEKVVIRVFDSSSLVQDLRNLGFEEQGLNRYLRMIHSPTGLILVTGPTGSGKTTTLYSSLREIASPEVNIVTIEDPVEMVLENFNQIQTQPKIDLTFASALKYVLRQDPDVIMVGEIRDGETAANAVQAALTGHLVLSTMHTNDAVSSIDRLHELGVRPYLTASTLNGIVAQRLVRKICPHCKQESVLNDEEMARLDIQLPDGAPKLKVWFGDGCVRCRYTGMFGRMAIFELFEATEKIKRLIKSESDVREVWKVARQDGMTPLRESAIRKLAQGITTADEILRVLSF